jgi:hypothetical protein
VSTTGVHGIVPGATGCDLAMAVAHRKMSMNIIDRVIVILP